MKSLVLENIRSIGFRLSRASIIMARAGAWMCVAVIAILSLIPAESVQRSDLGGHAEHVLAYAGTAVVVSFAYRSQCYFRIFWMLVVYAGCLEYLQRFSPGRNSNILDFLFSASGVALGMAVFLAGRSAMTALYARFGSDVNLTSRADVRDGRRR